MSERDIFNFGYIALLLAVVMIVLTVLVIYNDHEFNTAYTQGLRDGSTEHSKAMYINAKEILHSDCWEAERNGYTAGYIDGYKMVISEKQDTGITTTFHQDMSCERGGNCRVGSSCARDHKLEWGAAIFILVICLVIYYKKDN